MIINNASRKQMESLALWFFSSKTTPEGVLVWFKSRPHKYTIKGVKFNAISVANILRGMYIGQGIKKPRAKRKPKAKVEPEEDSLPF